MLSHDGLMKYRYVEVPLVSLAEDEFEDLFREHFRATHSNQIQIGDPLSGKI